MKSTILMAAVAAGLSLSSAGIAPALAEDLTIGYIGSLTGGAAQYGLAGQEALKIIAEEVNANGGLKAGGVQYTVKVASYDDRQKADQAVAAYQRLTTVDGANYILVQNSPSTLAIKKSAESDKVVLLTAAFSPKAIDPETKYTIRLYMNGDNFVPILISWFRKHLDERRVVTLNQNDETGWGFSETVGSHFRQNGFEVLANQLYDRATTDFAPILTRIIALKPQLIDLGATTPGTAGLIVRQAHELGYDGRFIQTGGPGWESVVATAGTEASENMVTMLYADPRNPAYAKIAAAYRKSVGQSPNELIVSFHDAANVLFKAIEAAGGPKDTTKVVEAFSKVLPMKSLQGETLQWGFQQILSVNYIAQIVDGKPTVIGKVPE